MKARWLMLALLAVTLAKTHYAVQSIYFDTAAGRYYFLSFLA
ncbi:MAG: hypothetical protein WC859_04490 [Elusimicrobiota bacterium]